MRVDAFNPDDSYRSGIAAFRLFPYIV